MKFLTFLMTVVLVSVISIAKAQTTTPSFTDEDLKKYAVVMDSVKDMQATLRTSITEMVQKNTVMSVERYNELFKIAGDEAKLAEAKATPEEIAFLKQVETTNKDGNAKVNSTFQSLVKDYLGIKQYSAIKKSLETDSTTKAKYESMTNELNSKGGE
jgi:hypothetical protein